MARVLAPERNSNEKPNDIAKLAYEPGVDAHRRGSLVGEGGSKSE
jgi:hypothetical protein